MKDEPAFPLPQYSEASGLTKREYFAGLAMQGLLANSDGKIASLSVQATTEISIEMADALLYELETTKP